MITINKTDIDFNKCKNPMEELNAFIDQLIYHLNKHKVSKIRVSNVIGNIISDSTSFSYINSINRTIKYVAGYLKLDIEVLIDYYLPYDDNNIYLYYDSIYLKSLKINKLLGKGFKELPKRIIIDNDIMIILLK